MSKGFKDSARDYDGPPRLQSGRKRAVNVSIDAEILALAKEMKINLSRALEDALRKATEEEQAKRFYEENKEFIDHHNALAEKYGTLTEAFYGPDAFDDPAV